MLINATTGGASTVAAASIGGTSYVGGRVNNARTSGTVPVTTSVGGGTGLLPGLTLTGATNGKQGITPPLPIWRRRSWSELNP
jgi:type IV pilus assembly protein PilY1